MLVSWEVPVNGLGSRYRAARLSEMRRTGHRRIPGGDLLFMLGLALLCQNLVIVLATQPTARRLVIVRRHSPPRAGSEWSADGASFLLRG
jgi:hypothetical protein